MTQSQPAYTPKGVVASVINLKGGVGKTTISSHVMRALFEKLKQKVLIIDFDPQFNLTQAILPQDKYDECKSSGKTIMKVMEPTSLRSLYRVSDSTESAPLPKDVRLKLWHIIGHHAELSLVPGDFRLVKFSLVEDSAALSNYKKRFKEFIDNARKEFDLICIDCNPSSSFMTRCALEVATHLIIPVRPDKFSVLGVDLLDGFINQLPTIPVKPKKIIVINGTKNESHDAAVENILRSDKKYSPYTLATKLKHSGRLTATNDFTGFTWDKPGPYKEVVNGNLAKLAIELGTELGLKNV